MKSIGLYPRVLADTTGTGVVSQAGALALVETVRVAGLDSGLSQVLARWRKPMARHDPAKVITDLAVTPAPGGDRLADIALLQAEPGVFSAVAVSGQYPQDTTRSWRVGAFPGVPSASRTGRLTTTRTGLVGATL